jgi:hypothetical protein
MGNARPDSPCFIWRHNKGGQKQRGREADCKIMCGRGDAKLNAEKRHPRQDLGREGEKGRGSNASAVDSPDISRPWLRCWSLCFPAFAAFFPFLLSTLSGNPSLPSPPPLPSYLQPGKRSFSRGPVPGMHLLFLGRFCFILGQGETGTRQGMTKREHKGRRGEKGDQSPRCAWTSARFFLLFLFVWGARGCARRPLQLFVRESSNNGQEREWQCLRVFPLLVSRRALFPSSLVIIRLSSSVHPLF